MYCIDTRAIAFMFNGGSSCGSTTHPIDTKSYKLWNMHRTLLSDTLGLSMQYILKSINIAKLIWNKTFLQLFCINILSRWTQRFHLPGAVTLPNDGPHSHPHTPSIRTDHLPRDASIPSHHSTSIFHDTEHLKSAFSRSDVNLIDCARFRSNSKSIGLIVHPESTKKENGWRIWDKYDYAILM